MEKSSNMKGRLRHTMQNLKVFNNRTYRKAIHREQLIWSKVAKRQATSMDNQHNLDIISEWNPVLTSYNNSLLGIDSIDPFGWLEHLKQLMPPNYNMQPCLSLGSGSGIIEERISIIFNIDDIKTIDIINDSLVMKNDLNFIDLENDRYSCIFACGILHHIINLEHLLYQVNKALKKNGLFIVYEYIGENKQQWNQNKVELLNNELKKRFAGRYQNFKVVIPKIDNIVPFESIRSSDISSTIDFYFSDSKIFELAWGGCSYPILHSMIKLKECEQQVFERSDITEILGFSTYLDRAHLFNESIKQCYLFGVYKNKSYKKPMVAQKWSTRKIKEELTLKLPLGRKIKYNLSYFLQNWPLLLKVYKKVKRI